MAQKTGLDDSGVTAAQSAAPTDGGMPRGNSATSLQVGGGRVRYAPVIGSGPLREKPASGPLVPVPQIESQAEQAAGGSSATSSSADRGVQLTSSGHEVPEFVAGSAHMVQMLAAEFPLGSLPEQGVGEAVGAAQALVQAAQSLLVSVTHEAISRGLPAQSGHSVPDWITTWAPSIDRPEALATARMANAVGDARFEALTAKVGDGSARVSRAEVIVRLTREMTPIATAESLQAVTDLMTGQVETTSLAGMKQVASAVREHLVEPGDDEDEDNTKAARRLLRRVGTVAGLAEWQLLLDEEGQAILTAALDPLSAPRPGGDEHGAHQLDNCTASTRRADALLEIIGRGVAAPEGQTQTEKAKIHVTIDKEALAGKVPGGGHTATGEHLSAGTIRRLACDAQIIPIMLGGPSEPLDVGRVHRLFTPSQRAAVLLRDRGCSFPGCSMPAGWTDIHHIVHWVFGGATDLDNAAALCRRHHVIVHRYGYTATVTDTEVIWHLNNGLDNPSGPLTEPLVDT
ncbi:HNH endonuclease [Ornithinimicrobium faecis]|uniref:HNH endonuclease n=1 Tax=Ornithinimicrobium faecis TaxID=2934158 RepID=A0ABY4YP47_9MICO|nr:HNH endonuclease signature motif containing protein [Ornithinimicrobium sp. HY1793]USQ78464.1 HNH endonuclease [Ornithinimicrobium sp. HY1793]